MKKAAILSLILFLSYHQLFAQSFYVSGAGNDNADGRSLAKAFRSLQKADSVVRPGDVVWIDNGIYTNSNRNSGSAVLSITRSGKSKAWITWKAIPGTHPEIRPSGWAGILISGSYHIIDGLTIHGANDSLVLLDAQNDSKKEAASARYNTNGIFVNGRDKAPSEKPHHIIIRNCTVEKCPGGGINAIESDYVTIEDCKVFENAWYMRYGGSGISTLTNWAYDNAPGYHMIIQRNTVWNNKTMVAWEKIGRLSDGNGIILDVTDQDDQGATNPNADAVAKSNTTAPPAAPKPKRPEWKGRSLVANNLSAYNGGSGIHTFRTKYVDIINNTTYHNGQIVGYPELFANSSEDIQILNNIIVPRPAGKVTSNNKNKGVRWDYNLYPVPQENFKSAHEVIADPDFRHLELDFTKSDFRVKKNSKALNAGTEDLLQKTDITGKTRSTKSGIELGAFQQ